MVKSIKQTKQTDNRKPNKTSDTTWIFAHDLRLKKGSRVHEFGVRNATVSEERINELIEEIMRENPKDFEKELNKRMDEESIKDYKDTHSGKWLIFCSYEDINDTWEKIKNLTEIGLLGNESKVSTLCRPKKYSDNNFVICVYTEDYRNKVDVKRVLNEIRNGGVKGRLNYKPDIMTVKGVYSSNSNKASLYRSDEFESAV